MTLLRVTLFARKLYCRGMPNNNRGNESRQDPAHERERIAAMERAVLTGEIRRIHTFCTGVTQHKPVRSCGLAASFFALAAALATPAVASAATFNKDIAPLIFEHCAACHRPGEAGPFSLLSYQDVRRHATQIVSVTRQRYMPPWLPEPGYGDFAGERRLSDAQISTIAEWVQQGMPEGARSDLPST